jgi:hypothetical protein
VDLQSKVAAILGGRYDVAEVSPPCLDVGDYAQIAQSVRDRAGRPDEWCDPRGFALALGYRVKPSPLCDCSGEATDGRVLLYRYSHDRRVRGTRIWHGIAHGELLRWGEHTEADAWLLTAELVVPARLAALWTPAALVAVQLHAHEWLIETAADMARLAAFVA